MSTTKKRPSRATAPKKTSATTTESLLLRAYVGQRAWVRAPANAWADDVWRQAEDADV